MNERPGKRETVAQRVGKMEEDVHARSVVALSLRFGGDATDAAALATSALSSVDKQPGTKIDPLNIARRAEMLSRAGKSSADNAKRKKGEARAIYLRHLEILGVDESFAPEVFAHLRRFKPAIVWQSEPQLRAIAVWLLDQAIAEEGVTNREITRILERAIGRSMKSDRTVGGKADATPTSSAEHEDEDVGYTPGYWVVNNIISREGEKNLRDRLASTPRVLTDDEKKAGAVEAESLLKIDRAEKEERTHRRTAYMKNRESRALLAELLEQGHALRSPNAALKAYLGIEAPLDIGRRLVRDLGGTIEAAVGGLRRDLTEEEMSVARERASEWMANQDSRDQERFARQGETLRRSIKAQERLRDPDYQRLMDYMSTGKDPKLPGLSWRPMKVRVGDMPDGSFDMRDAIMLELSLSDIEDGEERLKMDRVAKLLEDDIAACAAGYLNNGLGRAMKSASPALVRLDYIKRTSWRKGDEPKKASCTVL